MFQNFYTKFFYQKISITVVNENLVSFKGISDIYLFASVENNN